MKRHQLPPGPEGGYLKGGRPVKQGSTRRRDPRLSTGFITHRDGEGTLWAFTAGSTSLRSRFIGRVPKNVEGLAEVADWVDAQLSKRKRGLKEVSAGETQRLDRFLSEKNWQTSRNKK